MYVSTSHLKTCDPSKFNLNFPRYGPLDEVKGPSQFSWSRTLVIMKSGPQCESPTMGSTKLELFVECNAKMENVVPKKVLPVGIFVE